MKADRSFLSRGVSHLVYSGMQAFGGSSEGARILCYHRVNAEPDGYMSVPPLVFRAQMEWLASQGYKTVSLNELLIGRLHEKSVVLTFDDGYEDNFTEAYPVLKEFGFRATIFLVAERLGEPSYLKISQIKEMGREGFEFGSHTLSHPNLRKINREQKTKEIADSKIALEKLLGISCEFFCYPYGQHDEETIGVVRDAGYKGACCNKPGANRRISAPFLLRRTEVAPYDSPEHLKKKMAGAYDLLHRVLHKLRGRP